MITIQNRTSTKGFYKLKPEYDGHAISDCFIILRTGNNRATAFFNKHARLICTIDENGFALGEIPFMAEIFAPGEIELSQQALSQ